MTTVLAIIGSIVIILTAATQIPQVAGALLRACIPLIKDFHDLRDAIRRHPGHKDDQGPDAD
jgi:hypothetical protein